MRRSKLLANECGILVLVFQVVLEVQIVIVTFEVLVGVVYVVKGKVDTKDEDGGGVGGGKNIREDEMPGKCLPAENKL